MLETARRGVSEYLGRSGAYTLSPEVPKPHCVSTEDSTMRVRREPLEANAWTKFRLLMWKNFLQQWRHRWQTVLEVLLPVVTMLLILVVRSQIEPENIDVVRFQSVPVDNLDYASSILVRMELPELAIAYSPQSDLLEDVLRSAMGKLFVRNVPLISSLFPDSDLFNLGPDELYQVLRNSIRIDAYNSSNALRGIYAQEEFTRIVIAAVQFNDDLLGTTELPSDLSYALRFPERPRLNSFFSSGSRTWRTELVFPPFQLPGPRASSSIIGGIDPGYISEMFIALQHFISTELVSRATGEDLSDFNLRLQRLPHPPYLLDYAVEALQYLFPMFILLSFSYTAVNIVRAVTVEKELQLKEAMKVMGLPTWLHWSAWFCKQFLYLLFQSVLIVVLLKVSWFANSEGFRDYSVFTNTPWTVLWFFIILYLTCTIFFCFMLSGLFSKGSTAALFAGVFWYVTYIPAFLMTMNINMSIGVQTITCFCINSAMSYGFQLLLAGESTGGVQWGQFFFSPEADSTRFTFGHVVIMLVVNCVLYMLVALYLEQVFPGPFGIAQRWYFPFQKQFWCSNSKVMDEGVYIDETGSQEITREKDPTNHNPGVKINNLTKVYGEHVAVNNLNLTIYDDQITVLLGHNGAGKSTTISMITGNLKPTRGSIVVAGFDMSVQTRLARSHIGLCPQHNVLFNELTVKEHLEFFARLKGFTGKDLNDEIDSLIEKLELQEKRNYQSQGLSGGQKRRLAVGIALSGAARVVLLDEPTSGMDPASRRALWDLLQKEKHGRSIILTTHFMDEADILGDRVAIMAEGRLQCVGSPYFLKRHYGVGYTLIVVKDDGFQYDTCTALINKYIPGIGIKEDRGLEITYNLPNECSDKFESMLHDLENNTDNIRFKNYGLVCTTLEDVFMSVGSDVFPHNSVTEDGTESEDDVQKYEFESSMEELNKENSAITGVRLWCQHVLAIWMKLGLVWLRSWSLVLLQIAVPIVIINFTLGFLEFMLSFNDSVQRRELTLLDGYTRTETLLSYTGASESSLGSLAMAAYEQMFTSANVDTMTVTVTNEAIDEYYLSRSSGMGVTNAVRNQILTGATFDENAVIGWFSNFAYHDIATSLAAIHTALLKAHNPTANMTVYNYPLEANYSDQTDAESLVALLSMQLASGIGTSLGIVSAVFIMYYIRERVTRAKLLQKAAGINPILMWGSAAVFDWFWLMILCVPIVISCAAFQVIGLSTAAELGRMFLCLMVYGAAMVPLNYAFSYLFDGPALGFVALFFVNVLLGMMGPQVVDLLYSPFLDTKLVADILDGILQFFPLYSVITAVRFLNQVGLVEWTCMQACDYMLSVTPSVTECTMENLCEHHSTQCCARADPHWDWAEPGVMRYIVCMLVTCVVMWAILMFVEYRVYRKIFHLKKTPPPIDERTLDEDVVDEARHVQRLGNSDLGSSSLVANGLSKYYGKNLAVDQVSFTVGDRECFGLLGVNGAGKTSTFKMLMGDESISSGDASVGGHSVRTAITNVYENIGYCPQFDAVFGELTGRENLRFFAMLRGIPSEYAARRTESLAHSLGFTKHLDKKVDQYSGGNKRKLSTAVALLGRTRLVFVDEPTTGVDPAAKRQVWSAMRGAQRAGRGIVLTSHSMEECEALCTRLTIMVNGRFQCLGTPQHLKNKFSQGFTLTIKMKIEDNAASAANSTDAVKNYINSNFTNPKIMEEYQGLLTYYLSDRTMPWSRMFGVLERARRELDVEDYSIAQTTLEQIFLQFTKYQRESRPS